MAWPVMVELLLTGFINTGSQFFLNAFSPEAVAATGSLSQVVNIIINLYTIISVGGGVFLSLYVGAGREEECGRLARILFTGNLIFGLVVSVTGLLLIGPFMRMMRIDAALYGYGRVYLAIYLGLSFVQSLLITAVAVFRSFGRMKDVLVCNLIIYGVCFLVGAAVHFAVPRSAQRFIMYAMAGIIGQVSGIGYLFSRRGTFGRRVRDAWKRRPARAEFRSEMRRVLRVGASGGGEGLLYLLAQMALTAMVGALGTRALLVKSYLGIFSGYMEIAISGITTAVFILVGQYLGRRDYRGLRILFRRAITDTILLTAAVSVLCCVFRYRLIAIFTSDPAVTEICASLLQLHIVIEVVRVFTAISVAGMKAIGQGKDTMVMIVFGSLLQTLAAYVLAFRMGMGIRGIYFAILLDLGLRGLVVTVSFIKKSSERTLRSNRNRLIRRDPEAEP